MLSDLEVTYKWRDYLKPRPLARYSILVISGVIALGASMFGIFNPQWPFFVVENEAETAVVCEPDWAYVVRRREEQGWCFVAGGLGRGSGTAGAERWEEER